MNRRAVGESETHRTAGGRAARVRSQFFHTFYATKSGLAAGEMNRRAAGESETHRTAGGRAARVRSQFFHTFYATKPAEPPQAPVPTLHTSNRRRADGRHSRHCPVTIEA